MKKIFALLFLFATLSVASLAVPVAVTVPENALSEFEGIEEAELMRTYGNLTYSVVNGEVMITDCSEYARSVTIPSMIDGYPVTSIDYSAFDSCYSLTSITIPDSVTYIGNYAFGNCTSLTSITIPDSVTYIGAYAFYSCYSLTSVNIPDSVTSIGVWTFYNCESLTSITIPDSVTYIGNYAFDSCYGLTSITVDDNNAYYSSDERGVLFNKNKTNLIQYPAGNKASSYIIPDSVTSIGNYAFYNCTNLTSITIADSVTSIGERAFSSCDSLTSITVDDNNAYYSSDERGVLFNKNKTNLIQYPIGNTASSYIIPDSVTSIGSSAFNSCYGLTSVNIPDSVTSIGVWTFYNCESLTSINIPDGVTSIGSFAFDSCYGLTSVTIGNSVTSIGAYAFYSCYSLTSVNIPDGVTSIGNYAFYSCESLTNIYYNGTEDKWNSISIGSGNECLTDATRKFFRYVTLYSQNGEIFGKYMCETGKPLDTTNFEKVGQTLYLYTDSEYKNLYTLTTPVNENLTLYLKYVPKQYISKFVNYDGNVIWEGLVDYGAVITPPENPKREKNQQYTYTFSGWEGFEKGITQTNQEMVFTATYTSAVNQYTYKFLDEDGTILKEETIDYGTSIIPPEISDKTDYYIFDYWKDYNDGITITDDVTFKAVFKYKNYSVFAEGLFEPVIVTYSQDFTVDAQTRDGYMFIGYFTEHDGKGTRITDEKGESLSVYNVVGDLKVYPYFESVYMNKIELQGTSSAMPGDTITQRAIFATDKNAMYLVATIKYPEQLNFKSIKGVDFIEATKDSEKAADGYKYLDITCIFDYEGSFAEVNTNYIPFEIEFEVNTDATPGECELSIENAMLVGDDSFEIADITGHTLTILPKLAESIEIIGKDEIDTAEKFSAVISPDYTTDKSVEWSVNDETVATISQDGTLTPIKNGMVTITAAVKDGSEVFATKTVNVIAYATISELDFGGGVVSSEFDPNTREYTVTTDSDTIALTPTFSGGGVLRANGSGVWVSGKAKEFTLDSSGTTVITLNRENVPNMTDSIYTIIVISRKVGDLTGDKSVDINDAILLLQHSMFPDLYILDYTGSVDFTKDGAVDMNDAILLLQHSMFPDLVPIE